MVGQMLLGGLSVWFGGRAFGGGMKAKSVWKYHRYVSTHSQVQLQLTLCQCFGLSAIPNVSHDCRDWRQLFNMGHVGCEYWCACACVHDRADFCTCGFMEPDASVKDEFHTVNMNRLSIVLER